jgi:hypothetical protein
MKVDLYIYTTPGVPASVLNPLIDAVVAGLVSHCYIVGKVLKGPGDIERDGVAIIPVRSWQRRIPARSNRILYVPKQENPEVFVSYSRHDEALVKPLAAAIGIGRASSVFVDVEQLKAGNLWETELINAVRGSKVFVLCWCCEAAKSRFM